MAKNEKTSAKVASKASKLLRSKTSSKTVKSVAASERDKGQPDKGIKNSRH